VVNSPSEIPAIATTLKRLVRAKGLTYAELAQLLDISEASVKRYLNGQRLTMEILERLCGAMSLHLSEFYETGEGTNLQPAKGEDDA
jgi:transcriptional regulator with XRE-family HTH domain